MKRTSLSSVVSSIVAVVLLLISSNLLLTVAAAPGAPPQAHEPIKQGNWQTYTNVRFAYSICYPADVLTAQGEAENSDGQKFLSKDGRGHALVYGSNNALGQSVSEAYSDEQEVEEKAGIKITYKLLKPNYFVVSGSGKGKIIYQKTVLAGEVYKTLHLEYPEDQKQAFDSIVSAMSGCFHTNLKHQNSRTSAK